MTFLEAALELLKHQRKPLHFKKLAELAVKQDLLDHVGRTPETAMQTALANAIKKGHPDLLVRVRPGVFGLRYYPPAAAGGPAGSGGAGAEPEEEGERAEAAPAKEGRGKRGGRPRRRGRGGKEKAAELAAPAESAAESAAPESPIQAAEETAPVSRHGQGAANAQGAEEAEGAEEDYDTEALEAATESAEGADADDADEEIPVEEGGPLMGGAGSATLRAPNGESATVRSPAGGPAGAQAGLSGPGDDRRRRRRRRRRGRGGGYEGGADVPPSSEHSPQAAPRAEGAAAPTGGQHAPSAVPSAHPAHAPAMPPAGDRVLSLADAAYDILRSQPDGRPVHVRQITDMALKRRLIRQDGAELWRMVRAALQQEIRDRTALGLRPRIRFVGGAQFSIADRRVDGDLLGLERSLAERADALRKGTRTAISRRLSRLVPPAFETVARLLLERLGFRGLDLVKRTAEAHYLAATRPRGCEEIRTMVSIRPGGEQGRRSVGELRAGVIAKGFADGLLVAAGRLLADALSEGATAGPSVELWGGDQVADLLIKQGIGVVRTTSPIDYMDADFFTDLQEG